MYLITHRSNGRQVRTIACCLVFVCACNVNGREARRSFTVATDPNNLPFSNARGEGFENKLAKLVADELDAKLVYVWQPQRRGFVRDTLGTARCDALMGVPAGIGQC